jgi:hypothetical protein
VRDEANAEVRQADAARYARNWRRPAAAEPEPEPEPGSDPE